MLQRTRLPAKSILTRQVHLKNVQMQLKLLMALKATCLHLEVNVQFLQTRKQKLSYMLTLVLFLEFITSRYFIEQATQNGVSISHSSSLNITSYESMFSFIYILYKNITSSFLFNLKSRDTPIYIVELYPFEFKLLFDNVWFFLVLFCNHGYLKFNHITIFSNVYIFFIIKKVLQMDLSTDSWDFLCSYQTQRTKQLECFVFGTHCTPFILSQL